MTPQELKNSILQLAIQGKLTSNADCYTEEEGMPFKIPCDWKWVKASCLGKMIRGSGIKRGEVTDTGRPCIRYGQLYTTYKDKIVDVESHIPEELFAKCKQASFGDILMSLTGENEYDIALARPYCGNETVAIGGDMTMWTKHGQNPVYLSFVMNSPYGIKCKSHMATGKIIVHISNDKLGLIDIPLPPLEEQDRIVAKIEELLPYIEKYEEAWTKLEEFNKKFPDDMQKSILQMAIQGKLVEQRPEEGTAEELYQQIQAEKQMLIREGKIKKEKELPKITGDEIPFDIPESWKWVRLHEIAFLENGDRSSKYPVSADYVNYGIPFFGAKDMGDDFMLFDDVRYISQTKFDELGNGKLQNDDFICLLRGSVGKCSQFKANENIDTGFICAQMVIIRCVDKCVCEYLRKYFNSPYYKTTIESKTTGTAVRQLPAKELGSILIPLPPTEEQKRIVAKTEEILPFCEKLI